MSPRQSASIFRIVSSVGFLFLTLAVESEPSGFQGQKNEPKRDEVLAVYKPVAGDFRQAYVDDSTNSQVQTWDQYWSWVNSYYEGNFVSNGWIKETDASLARVIDPSRRAELLKEMNEAGRLVSREWAKAGSARKVETNDLIAWGNRLKTARLEEKGTGTELLATVRLIHSEAKRKISGKPETKPKVFRPADRPR